MVFSNKVFIEVNCVQIFYNDRMEDSLKEISSKKAIEFIEKELFYRF